MNALRTTQQDNVTLLRIRFVQALAVITILATIGVTGVRLLQGAVEPASIALTLGISIGLVLMNTAALMLASQRFLVPATFCLALSTVLGAAVAPEAYPVLAALALVTVAVLGNRTTFLLAALLVYGRGLLDLWELGTRFDWVLLRPELTYHLRLLTVLLLMGIAMRVFAEMANLTTTRARRSADLLRTTSEVGRITAGLLNLDELLPRAAESIRDGFALFHVQVFMVNETGDDALLAASTGEIGQQLLAEKHHVPAAPQTLVGRMLQSGEPVLSQNFGGDSINPAHPALARTRSQLVLPIMDSSKIIGALDVHSLRANALDGSDIQALQVMANQLAVAIRNARLFESQSRSVQENKRLFLEAQTKLYEIQRLNQQLTKAAWSVFLQERRALQGVNLTENILTPESSWSEAMALAAARRQPISRKREEKQVFAVPIVLRGEVLGAIEVEPTDDIHEGDTLEMMKAVAERLATTLENTRLLEQTQADTAQRQRIGEIVERYQSVTTVDELLRITLTELSQSLGATRGAIRLGTANEAQPA